MTPHRATRDIHLGGLRMSLRQGEVILAHADGATVTIRGKAHLLPVLDALITSGALKAEPAAVGAQLPAVTARALPAQAPAPAAPDPKPLNARGERVPFASPEALAANGVRPEAGRQHVWDGADWLNNTDGPVCKVCGVTKLSEGRLILVDRQRGDGTQQHHYRDAHGNMITTFEELSCPVYVGDANSAAATAKEHVRRVRGRIDEVETRLARLEAENLALREALLAQPTAEDIMEALQRKLQPVAAAPLALPAPAFDAEAEEVPPREREVVPATPTTEDEEEP